MTDEKYNPGVLRGATPLKEQALSDLPPSEWPYIYIVGGTLYRVEKEEGEP